MRALAALFFIALLLIASPASAAYVVTNVPLYEKTNTNFLAVKTVDFDAIEINERIALIQFEIPTGSYVNFTLYYGSGSTLTGFSENHIIGVVPWLRTQSAIMLNGTTKTYDYLDQQPYYDFNLAGYAKDDVTKQSGFMVYDLGYGSYDNDLAVFSPVANIGSNTIYRIVASGPQDFNMYITSAAGDTVAKGSSQSLLDAGLSSVNEWVQLAVSIASFVYGFVTSLFYWLKFFLWDNLLLTVALYITLTMAFAARAARGNPARFLRQWFRDQRAFFVFIIDIWRALVDVISTFRSIFRI